MHLKPKYGCKLYHEVQICSVGCCNAIACAGINVAAFLLMDSQKDSTSPGHPRPAQALPGKCLLLTSCFGITKYSHATLALLLLVSALAASTVNSLWAQL